MLASIHSTRAAREPRRRFAALKADVDRSSTAIAE